VADFVFLLENTGYFQDVNLSFSQKKELKPGVSAYEFEVTLGLKNTDEIMYE
jgi:hypothetical protein